MTLQSFTECIEEAVQHAEFRNVFGNRFGSSVMHELYSKKTKRGYSLSNTDAISMPERKLTALVAEISPELEGYMVPETGAVCNGLYYLMGSLASPPLPSVADYAKTLVVAAARNGAERVANLVTGWTEGVPVRVRLCALLKGVRTDGPLSPVDGLHLETLPSNANDFPRSLYVQIDEHDIRHEQYSHRAMLSLEHDSGPALFSPYSERDSLFPPRPRIRNRKLSSLSVVGLCRSMSLEVNSCVDWFMQWWDYGDVDAFFLNAGFSRGHNDTRNPSPKLISEEQLVNCLELHGLLEKYTALDRGIARWQRSKWPLGIEEQLVDLRIALESVLLSDDRGIVGEKRQRLGIRGAWMLGDTFERRKEYFRTLRKAYDFASSVVHAGSPKEKDRERLAKVIVDAQDLCREAILRIVRAGAVPNWSDLIMGKGYQCVAEDDVAQ